jgi:hypothetical protein
MTVVVVGLVLAACSGEGSSATDDREGAEGGEALGTLPQTEPERFAGGDFYAVPEPLPEGEPGALLRYEPADDVSIVGGTVWRVMYLSETLQGDTIAVTGLVVVPTALALPEGRPLVTVASWTTGIADQCASSRDPNSGALPLTAQFVGAGYVVALSDYEGLGTPGRHPYLVGGSEGRSVLGAAKAATQLPGADVGSRYAIIGYSQGGHGALWANELAEDWGPELDLVGAVAGAPVTEMRSRFSGRPVSGFFISMVAGFQAAYPDADPSLLLTDAGLASLDLVDQGCIGDVFAAVAALGDEQLLRSGPTPPAWARLLEENDPGQVAVDSPVLILHSQTDELLPASLSESLFERMCTAGQVVERRTYDTGETHMAAAPAAFADGFTWIDRLMEDEATAQSTCP